MRRAGAAVVVVTLAAVLAPSRSSAHESVIVGDLRVSVGWREEPAYASLPNAVEVVITDLDEVPVDDPDSQLAVTVAFGDESILRPLVPGDEPGTYSALVVPTQAGTYSFHITGAIAGETLGIEMECSDSTFDCVIDASEVELPADVPSQAVVVAADEDSDDDALSVVALVLSAVALLGMVGLFLVGRRTRDAG